MKYVVGIDPGVSAGAICLIESPSGKLVGKWTLERHPSGGLDLFGLDARIKLIKHDLSLCKWYLEDIHSIWGTSKSSTAIMMRGLGNLEQALASNFCDFEMVQPKRWQKIWEEEDLVYKDSLAKRKVKDTKQTSLRCVKRLYPTIDLRYGDNESKKSDRRTKPHSGIVDALLIARSQLNIQKDEQRIG